MIEYVYEQETTFAPLPNKFEAGTQNVEGVIGLGAAIDYIKNIGYNKIQEIEKEVTSYARQELSKLEYLTLYLTPNEEKHSSVISFNNTHKEVYVSRAYYKMLKNKMDERRFHKL